MTGQPQLPELFTTRYQAFDPAWGVPVAITRGLPRGNWFRHPLERIRELAPTRELFAIEQREEFEPAYRAQLELHGPELLAERFRAIGDRHGGRPMILLCYEDLTKPGEWCHRNIAADWICEKQLAQEVRELGPGAI
jgi:hypothetical protein